MFALMLQSKYTTSNVLWQKVLYDIIFRVQVTSKQGIIFFLFLFSTVILFNCLYVNTKICSSYLFAHHPYLLSDMLWSDFKNQCDFENKSVPNEILH